MRFVAVFALVFCGLCAAQDVPLGDLARQQKAISRPAAKRVIDNETLPHASPSEASNGAVAMAKSAESTAEEKQAAPKQISASTSAIPADAQKRLDELKATAQAQQRAVKKFEEELKDESVSAERRQLFEDGLSTAKQALEQVTKELAAVEQSVKPAEHSTQPQDASATAAAQSTQPEDSKAKPANSEAKPDEAAAPQSDHTDQKGSDSQAPEKSPDIL